MSIVNRKKEKPVTNVKKEENTTMNNEVPSINFTLDELEFMIRLIGNSNFKGNDLMFIYELVNKLQNLYLDEKGVK